MEHADTLKQVWGVQWTPSNPATLGTSQSVLISYSELPPPLRLVVIVVVV